MTDYGTVILVYLSKQQDRLCSANDVAAGTHVAGPTARKLLNALTRYGLVESVRGADGGYRLARPPEAINAAQILDALEGPIAITECSTDENHCELAAMCTVGSAWQRINGALRAALADISLRDLARPAAELAVIDLGMPTRYLRN